MRNPTLVIGNLPASGSQRTRLVPLTRARSVSVTGRITYNSSATSAVDIEVYYSPDGSNIDTVKYGTLTLTLNAGNTVQRSAVIVVPEHGYLQFRVLNNDGTYAATACSVWYSVQSWEEREKAPSHGSLQHDQGEDE